MLCGSRKIIWQLFFQEPMAPDVIFFFFLSGALMNVDKSLVVSSLKTEASQYVWF